MISCVTNKSPQQTLETLVAELITVYGPKRQEIVSQLTELFSQPSILLSLNLDKKIQNGSILFHLLHQARFMNHISLILEKVLLFMSLASFNWNEEVSMHTEKIKKNYIRTPLALLVDLAICNYPWAQKKLNELLRTLSISELNLDAIVEPTEIVHKSIIYHIIDSAKWDLWAQMALLFLLGSEFAEKQREDKLKLRMPDIPLVGLTMHSIFFDAVWILSSMRSLLRLHMQGKLEIVQRIFEIHNLPQCATFFLVELARFGEPQFLHKGLSCEKNFIKLEFNLRYNDKYIVDFLLEHEETQMMAYEIMCIHIKRKETILSRNPRTQIFCSIATKAIIEMENIVKTQPFEVQNSELKKVLGVQLLEFFKVPLQKNGAILDRLCNRLLRDLPNSSAETQSSRALKEERKARNLIFLKSLQDMKKLKLAVDSSPQTNANPAKTIAP